MTHATSTLGLSALLRPYAREAAVLLKGYRRRFAEKCSRYPSKMTSTSLPNSTCSSSYRAGSDVGFVWLRSILADKTSRNLFFFLCLNLSFAFVELMYGIWSNSLGLISDSFHMFFDCTALLAGLAASVISRWRSNDSFSYGYVRAEVLAGFVNGLFLIFTAFFVFSEGVERALEPPDVHHERLLPVSIAGLLVNLVGIFVFQHGGHGHSHDGEENIGTREYRDIMFGDTVSILKSTVSIFEGACIVSVSISISKPSSQDNRIIPLPRYTELKVWTYFGFSYKEATKEIDKSHFVCKIGYVKIQILRKRIESESVMATVILYLMAVWDMDTVMEATVMSPNKGMITDMITGIHTEDMAIHMTIPTATMTTCTHREKAPASKYYKCRSHHFSHPNAEIRPDDRRPYLLHAHRTSYRSEWQILRIESKAKTMDAFPHCTCVTTSQSHSGAIWRLIWYGTRTKTDFTKVTSFLRWFWCHKCFCAPISVVPLLRESIGILMQRTPPSLDHALPECYQRVQQLQGVYNLQEPHFWTLCTDVYIGTLKLLVAPDADSRWILSQTHNIFTQESATLLICGSPGTKGLLCCCGEVLHLNPSLFWVSVTSPPSWIKVELVQSSSLTPL
ncbi:Zinc transporter 7 [Anabarilius grahami]|uniref:Zinc transporter n=1 Tax=Anabarilius grahami TaxID=495550 RepID=A0A3N0Y3W6_ANAGA|nr:Zinc transporter 7 [Anabarilius grahami]